MKTMLNKKTTRYLLMSFALVVNMLLVSCDGNTEVNINKFEFTTAANADLRTTVSGKIDESAKTILLSVPVNADLTTLVATYGADRDVEYTVTVNGTEQINGLTPNDFTSPVVYTATTSNGSKTYTVTVEPDTVYAGNITVDNQEELDSLAGFTSVTGSLHIQHTTIQNLDALNSLTSAGSLAIMYNHSLSNIDGLRNLTTVDREIWIDDNPLLTSLSAFSNVTSVKSIGVHRCPAVISMDGFERITYLGGGLTIFDSGVRNLNGLANLKIVAVNIVISGNPALTDVRGLGKLTTVGEQNGNGVIRFTENDALVNLDGLSALTHAFAIIIDNNAALENVSSFEAVDSLHQLIVNDNPKLANWNTMSSLSSVQYYASIASNNSLTNLNFLSNLTSIAANLTVDGNTALTSLGLTSLNSVGGDFKITNNTELPTALATELSQQTSIGGSTTISGNK